MRTVITQEILNYNIIIGLDYPVVDWIATKRRALILGETLYNIEPVFFEPKKGEYLISNHEARIIEGIINKLKPNYYLTDNYEIIEMGFLNEK